MNTEQIEQVPMNIDSVQPENLTFGQALEALKQGNRIARKGWNGKGMFLYLNKGSVAGIPLQFGNIPASQIDGLELTLFDTNGHEGTVTRLPNINMHTATGAQLLGWLASQSDLLASDWRIIK